MNFGDSLTKEAANREKKTGRDEGKSKSVITPASGLS